MLAFNSNKVTEKQYNQRTNTVSDNADNFPDIRLGYFYGKIVFCNVLKNKDSVAYYNLKHQLFLIFKKAFVVQYKKHHTDQLNQQRHQNELFFYDFSHKVLPLQIYNTNIKTSYSLCQDKNPA